MEPTPKNLGIKKTKNIKFDVVKRQFFVFSSVEALSRWAVELFVEARFEKKKGLTNYRLFRMIWSQGTTTSSTLDIIEELVGRIVALYKRFDFANCDEEVRVTVYYQGKVLR